MDNRVKALVGENWSEFVLMIKDVMLKDSGDYECQVSGPNHTSISKMLKLNVISKLISAHNMIYKLFFKATSTHIDNGPDIYVGVNSRLTLICRIYTGGIPLKYLIWREGDKVKRLLLLTILDSDDHTKKRREHLKVNSV